MLDYLAVYASTFALVDKLNGNYKNKKNAKIIRQQRRNKKIPNKAKAKTICKGSEHFPQ